MAERHRARPFRPLGILGALVAAGVDFVVIGGIAGGLHGAARATFDLDVTYSRERENLSRLGAVLRELDAKLAGEGLPTGLPFQLDAEALRRSEILTLSTRFGRLDLLASPRGAPGYRVLRDAAVAVELDGAAVRVAALDDLIAMKRAAQRPKDRADLAEYVELARLGAG